MAKNTKYRYVDLSFYDQIGLTRMLCDMALEGWMLVRPGRIFWKFRKCPPQDLAFAITYFPKASDFDPRPLDAQLDKEEICSWEGWQVIARQGVMEIWCNPDPTAQPLETDPVVWQENLWQAMRKNVLRPQLLSMFMEVYFILFQLLQCRRDPVNYLSSPSHLYILPVFFLCVFISIREMAFCLGWRKKAKADALQGRFYHVRTRSRASWIFLAFAATLLVLSVEAAGLQVSVMVGWLVFMAVLYWIADRVKGALKKKNLSKQANFILTVGAITAMTTLGMFALTVGILSGVLTLPDRREPVGQYDHYGSTRYIYNDRLPVEIEDYLPDRGQWSKEADRQETFLLRKTDYSQRPTLVEPNKRLPHWEYTVIDVKAGFLYDLVLEEMLEIDEETWELFEKSWRPCEEAYTADALWREYYGGSPSHGYIIAYPDRIVELEFYDDVGEDILRDVVKVLKP